MWAPRISVMSTPSGSKPTGCSSASPSGIVDVAVANLESVLVRRPVADLPVIRKKYVGAKGEALPVISLYAKE